MFSAFSKITNLVADASSTFTQSERLQNVKEKVASFPVQTKEYFYPSPEQYEMKSVVRLDDDFFVKKDIEEYITPGQQQLNPAQLQGNHLNIEAINTKPVKPTGNALKIVSWHEFGMEHVYVYI